MFVCMYNMYYEIEKFDPINLRNGSTVLITGPRASGKTTLMKALTRDIKGRKIVFDPCSDKDNCSVFDKYLLVKDVACANIERLIETILRQHSDFNPHTLIFDDCASMVGILKNQSMRKLLANSKHMKINTFILEQIPELDAFARSHINYVFILRENIMHKRNKIYDNYFNRSDLSFSDFNKLLDACTLDRNCLVIDRNTNKMFWYNAVTPENYTIVVEKSDASMHRCIMRTRLIANELAHYVSYGAKNIEKCYNYAFE